MCETLATQVRFLGNVVCYHTPRKSLVFYGTFCCPSFCARVRFGTIALTMFVIFWKAIVKHRRHSLCDFIQLICVVFSGLINDLRYLTVPPEFDRNRQPSYFSVWEAVSRLQRRKKEPRWHGEIHQREIHDCHLLHRKEENTTPPGTESPKQIEIGMVQTGHRSS